MHTSQQHILHAIPLSSDSTSRRLVPFRFGPYDVVVRVSIGGDPYTVSEVYYSYYANTSAKKCICFGPGLRQGLPSGQALSFMMQCKDQSGKLRTTGDDPIDVTITGPSQDLIEKPTVEDLHNGTYIITYYVPNAGTYEITTVSMSPPPLSFPPLIHTSSHRRTYPSHLLTPASSA